MYKWGFTCTNHTHTPNCDGIMLLFDRLGWWTTCPDWFFVQPKFLNKRKTCNIHCLVTKKTQEKHTPGLREAEIRTDSNPGESMDHFLHHRGINKIEHHGGWREEMDRHSNTIHYDDQNHVITRNMWKNSNDFWLSINDVLSSNRVFNLPMHQIFKTFFILNILHSIFYIMKTFEWSNEQQMF